MDHFVIPTPQSPKGTSFGAGYFMVEGRYPFRDLRGAFVGMTSEASSRVLTLRR